MDTILKTATLREDTFIRLYQTAFPKAATFIRTMGGNLEEAKDIFQDALVIYYENVFLNKSAIRVNEESYLTGICKHLWYKKHKENSRVQELNSFPEILFGEPEPQVSGNILRFVAVSGKKCLELLKAFYYDKSNMKDLALKFGFSGERSAAAQKFKCLEKVRLAIRNRLLKKEDFYE